MNGGKVMYQVYTVKEGDTIDVIAQKFKVDPSMIYKINGFNIDYVPSVGTNVIVPIGQNAYFDYYTIKKGDNLYAIAKNYGIDFNLLAKLNGIDSNDYIYPGQTIIVPKKDAFIYITKEGDTLNGLLDMTGKTIQDLMSQNMRIYLMPEQLIVYKEK